MSYADASLNRIREYARINGITRNEIARMSHVWEGSLRRLWDDSFNPKLDTLRRIEAIVPSNFMPLPPHARRSGRVRKVAP